MIPKERELAYVKRWGIIRAIRSQSVAEHAYFVTRYLMDIYKAMGMGQPRMEMVEYSIRHDDGELHSGDIPTPYKKLMGLQCNRPKFLWEMTDLEWELFKAADTLEAILFLVDEELLGNKTVSVVCNEMCEQLSQMTFSIAMPDGEALSKWLWLRIDAHRQYKGRLS